MTDEHDQTIINQITAIRAKNNFPWMRLLEIALKYAPQETRAVLREINSNDREITGLLKDLAQ